MKGRCSSFRCLPYPAPLPMLRPPWALSLPWMSHIAPHPKFHALESNPFLYLWSSDLSSEGNSSEVPPLCYLKSSREKQIAPRSRDSLLSPAPPEPGQGPSHRSMCSVLHIGRRGVIFQPGALNGDWVLWLVIHPK